MKKQKCIALAVISCFTVTKTIARDAGNLDSVVIRDNRLQLQLRWQNRDIAILDKQQIRSLPVKSVNELLGYVSGVDIRQRGPWGAQADVSIDGSTFDQVLVLINGVKISDPQTGHNMMNLSLPIGSIDHIEVLRGAAARVYGVNALAGAINIVTVQPKENEVFAQAYAGSSFKTDTTTGKTYAGWGVQAAATLAAQNQSHMIGLAHDEGNGYRHNTAFDGNKVFYQNHFTLNSKNAIDAMGIYSRNHFGANGFYSSPGDKESVETVETALGSIAYTFQPNAKVRITPRLSYRYNKDNYIYIQQKPEVYHNIHETNVVTGEVQSSIRMGNGTLGLGAELRNEQINSTNLGKRERNNLGIYAEYKHLFFSRLSAGAGLYANYNSDYNWQVYPGADAGFQLNRNWKLFASFNTGQRLPTYTDLYYKGPLNIGNDQLRPETTTYSEGGIQYRERALFAKASYFYRHTTDFIDWVRSNDMQPWQPQNFQTLNTKGLSLQANFDFGEQLHFSHGNELALNLSYTYLDQNVADNESQKTKYTIEALRHQFIAKINAQLLDHIEISFGARYQYRISANDYTLLDARVGYRWRKWLLYAEGNNLLDTQYKETGTVPLPGSWYALGLRFTGKW